MRAISRRKRSDDSWAPPCCSIEKRVNQSWLHGKVISKDDTYASSDAPTLGNGQRECAAHESNETGEGDETWGEHGR